MLFLNFTYLKINMLRIHFIIVTQMSLTYEKEVKLLKN